MKNLTRLAAITIALVGLSTSAHAAKKKSFDFSDFKGNYTGTGSLTAGSQVLAGTASITVAVPKSGSSATVTINGTIAAGGTTLPISNVITFAKNKTFSQSQILYGVIAPGVPISGGYTGKKAITFSAQTAVGSTPVAIQATLTVKPLGKKQRRLVLTSVLSVPGTTDTYTFNFEAVAKVKPPKK